MIFARLATLLCAAAVVVAALPEANAANGGLPPIDLQKRCRNSENTVIEMMADKSLQGSAFDTCMRAEQDARKALQDAWTEIPPSYKSYCVRRGDYSPSYIEWIACVELMIDLKKLRATNVKYDRTSDRCPYIQYAADGSIKGLTACAL